MSSPRTAVRCIWLLLLVLAGPALNAPAIVTIHPWVPLFKGVDFTTAEADQNEPRMHKLAILRVDLADPDVELFSTPSNGDAPLETFGQTTTTFVETYAVSAAVNANFFSPVNTTPNDPRDLSGLAISRGTVVSPAESGRPMVLITRSNTVTFTAAAPPNPAGYWTAVAGSDLVVRQGVNRVSPDCNTSFCGPNPRTAIGITVDRRYLFLVVIDGRQPGWSDGATLLETGDWLLRLGAWDGLNLDGGGSSAMARLTNGSAVLLNRPSGGVQRVNGNHFGFFAKPLSPVILTHPASQTVSAWQPVTFTVIATGLGPFTYQWRLNGSIISSATQSSYRIARAQPEHAGAYSVTVSNAYGSAVSSNAILEIMPVPEGLISAGDNSFGQAEVPPQATNLVAVAAGGWHSLALDADGHLFAWGNNSEGQASLPADLSNVVAIAAGGYHSLALDAGTALLAWGSNFEGQIALCGGWTDVWALSGGAWHTLALKRDGTVVAWGDNSSGQTNVPPVLSGVVGIAAGHSHSLALKTNGVVVAWGWNLNASGEFVGQAIVPFGLTGIVAIAAGGWHNLALRTDGTVTGWGDNSRGQAIPPVGLTNVAGIAAGALHSLALLRDGTIRSWGDNSHGQGTFPPANRYVAIAAGGYHSLALLDSTARPPRWLAPRFNGQLFSGLAQSQLRASYLLEYTDSPAAGPWNTLGSVPGNGALLLLSDPGATSARRFYRVKMAPSE